MHVCCFPRSNDIHNHSLSTLAHRHAINVAWCHAFRCVVPTVICINISSPGTVLWCRVKQIPIQLVKSLQFIWRSGTRKFNLRVSNFQMICSELTRMVDYQNSSHTTMAVPAICVLVTSIDGWYDTISLWHCPNITRCYIQHTNGRQNVDHTLNLQKKKKKKKTHSISPARRQALGCLL